MIVRGINKIIIKIKEEKERDDAKSSGVVCVMGRVQLYIYDIHHPDIMECNGQRGFIMNGRPAYTTSGMKREGE